MEDKFDAEDIYRLGLEAIAEMQINSNTDCQQLVAMMKAIAQSTLDLETKTRPGTHR